MAPDINPAPSMGEDNILAFSFIPFFIGDWSTTRINCCDLQHGLSVFVLSVSGLSAPLCIKKKH